MQRLVPWKSTFLLHILQKRDAIHKFHDNVFQCIVMADIIDSNNIRMRKHGNGMRLRAKSASDRFICSGVFPHNLYGNIPVQAAVRSTVHPGHPAVADQRQDLISVVERFADPAFHFKI